MRHRRNYIHLRPEIWISLRSIQLDLTLGLIQAFHVGFRFYPLKWRMRCWKTTDPVMNQAQLHVGPIALTWCRHKD